MIVTRRDGDLLLITQPDHARVAGEVLSLWRADGVPRHPRRDDLLFAAREHDNGWREADAAPRLAADGRPADFLALPDDERRAIWRRGVERFAAARPYAAALIAEHALELHRGRAGEAAWDEFLEAVAARQAELLTASDATAAEAAADHRFLRWVDAISLAAGAGWEGIAEPGLAGRRDGDRLLLAPFPLAGATTFRLPCRLIPDRAYSGEADLAGALGPARWRELPFRLAPPGERPAGP